MKQKSDDSVTLSVRENFPQIYSINAIHSDIYDELF